jgi:hypothetical protein
MTADLTTPRAGWFTRARWGFRRWRKGRPFWGGFWLVLGGIELYLSANRDLGQIHVHFGFSGYLTYVLPLVLVLCGALVWASPSQRVFYGIIGSATAIFSGTALNLGGFLIGLLFGIIGGGLSAAWVPDKRGFGKDAADGDGDGDGVPDAVDDCPHVANPDGTPFFGSPTIR